MTPDQMIKQLQHTRSSLEGTKLLNNVLGKKLLTWLVDKAYSVKNLRDSRVIEIGKIEDICKDIDIQKSCNNTDLLRTLLFKMATGNFLFKDGSIGNFFVMNEGKEHVIIIFGSILSFESDFSGVINKYRDIIEKKSQELKEYHKKYKKEHGKEYREKYKNKIKEYQRYYCLKNKDKMKEYREKNKDKMKEYQKEYREKNRQQKHKERRTKGN